MAISYLLTEQLNQIAVLALTCTTIEFILSNS